MEVINMSKYSFEIHKGDHLGDLHVHVFYSEGRQWRKLLGKFRIPGLEPLPGTVNRLTNEETRVLNKWLSNEKQLNKLQDCLKSTVFSSDRLLSEVMNKGEVTLTDSGETYIMVKIPISKRL
jgi:hypothetical protein